MHLHVGQESGRGLAGAAPLDHVVLAEAAQLGLENRGWSQHRAGASVLAVSWGAHTSSPWPPPPRQDN